MYFDDRIPDRLLCQSSNREYNSFASPSVIFELLEKTALQVSFMIIPKSLLALIIPPRRS